MAFSGRSAVLLRLLLVLMLAATLPARAATGPDDPAALFGKRVALVIGNGAYGDLGTLPNPPRDAADMADKLASLDFQVISVIDGDRDAMKEALRRFAVAAVNADVALVFYAGHGLAMNGQNYLVPVGAQISLEPDVEDETVSLDDVRRRLDFTGAKVMMVILDACRNNPLADTLKAHAVQLGRSLSAPSSQGLAEIKADGMMIAYSAAPGEVAFDGTNQRNSPFTKALLDNIGAPQTDVRVMFSRVRSAVIASTNDTQRPWTEDGIDGEFQFNPVPAEPEKPKAPERTADLVAWPEIRGSSDPAVFENFIASYPDSILLSDARDRLTALKDPAMEGEAWKALSGSVDPAAYEVFLRRYPDGIYAPVASFKLETLVWQQLDESKDVAGIKAFLQRFPASSYGPLARRTLADLEARQPAEPPAAQPAVAAVPAAESPPAPVPEVPAQSGMTMAALAPDAAATGPAAAGAATRLLTLVQPDAKGAPSDGAAAAALARANELAPHFLQIALAALGYYDGRTDGKFGSGSRKAAARFQEHLGAPPTGDLQPREIVELISAAAESGNADSQTVYGLMFAQGQGVVQDYGAAAIWFRRAAASNNGNGQMNLGVLYRDGLGVPKDPAEARRLFRLAASNGQPAATKALEDMD